MTTVGFLELHELGCFRNDRFLFEGLNLALDAGDMLVVEGPNGCGKTSLLRILTGLRLADGGEVRWQGEEIGRLGGDYAEQIGYIGHHDGIKPELSCLENLRLARAMGIPAGPELDEVLDRVDLYHYGDHEVGRLSAGQKRRLALARLLATESRLWILDEPFTSLDRAAMSRFTDVFQTHLEGGGLIVVTSHHDIELPARPVQRLDLGRAS